MSNQTRTTAVIFTSDSAYIDRDYASTTRCTRVATREPGTASGYQITATSLLS